MHLSISEPHSSYKPTHEHVAKTICGWVYRSRDGLLGIFSVETDLSVITVMRPDGSRLEMLGREIFNLPKALRCSAQAKRRMYTDTQGDMWIERSEWVADSAELLEHLRMAEMEGVA